MPEISRFLGIIIYMHYRDHAPPHFHASYGKFEIVVEVESGIILGKFPKRALKAVKDWYNKYKAELCLDWELARKGKPLNKIEPLE